MEKNIAQEKFADILNRHNLDVVIEQDDFPVDLPSDTFRLKSGDAGIERVIKPFDRDAEAWGNDSSPFCFDLRKPLDNGSFDPHSLFLYTNTMSEVSRWLRENYDYQEPTPVIGLEKELRAICADENIDKWKKAADAVYDIFFEQNEYETGDKDIQDIDERFYDFMDEDNSEAFERHGHQIPSLAILNLLKKVWAEDSDMQKELEAAITDLSQWNFEHKKQMGGKLYEADQIKKDFAAKYGAPEAAASCGIFYIDRPDYPTRFENDERKINMFYVMHQNLADQEKIDNPGRVLNDVVAANNSVMDGDVWAYRIIDKSTEETLESCGGFVNYDQSENAMLEAIEESLKNAIAAKQNMSMQI